MTLVNTGPGPAGARAAPSVWTAVALGTVALCFAINMADGVDVAIMSFVAPRLTSDWGITPEVMGRLFSAGLIGMAVGGMGIAPLADRLGRRRMILAALVLMSAAMVASSQATGPAMLFALRVVVGAGIGTVLPAMTALASEAAPEGQSNLAVGLVQAGYPFAAVFTGLAAAHLLPLHGWRGLMGGAGAISLVLLPLAWLVLPRDTRAPDDGQPAGDVKSLFRAPFRPRTLALWGATFFGLMVLYFIVSWIPKLAIAAGLSETNGIYAGALYNLGAFVGTVAMSALAVRVPLGRLVPGMLAGATLAMLVFGWLHMAVAPTMAVAFTIGVLLQGGYNGVWVLAAAAYPPRIRATGVGWAIGIGRGGAVIGPWAGGMLMGAHMPLPSLFAAFCLPLLVCAGCAGLVARLSGGHDTSAIDRN